MEHSEQTQGNEAFGSYLRKLREGRRLSLDAVEEMSSGFPEKVTKSHLSRIENGLALPSFPRLMAMSHIYGVPIASLAERYEFDLRRGMAQVDLEGHSEADLLATIDRLVQAGELEEGLSTAWALFERRGEMSFAAPLEDTVAFELRIRIITSMILGGKLESAKSLTEQALGAKGLSEPQRLVFLQLLATSSYRLRRFTVATLAVEECRKGMGSADLQPRFAADIDALSGNVQRALGRSDASIALYESAIERYRAIGIEYGAASAAINLGQVLCEVGKIAEARETIALVTQSLESGAYSRLRALAYCVRGKIEFHDGKLELAERWLAKSNVIARQSENTRLIFNNCFYLWKVAHAKGDVAAIRLNERTLRSLLGRIESEDPEVEEFRETTARADS